MRARALVLVAVAVLAGCVTPPAPPEKPPDAAADATYAGNDLCVACHTDQGDGWDRTPHGRAFADASRPVEDRGCEACHGPGSLHAEAGGGKGVGGLHAFDREDAAAGRSRACLRCHGGNRALHDFLAGEHALSSVACTDCHRIHGGAATPLLAEKPPDLCYGCHPDVRARFALTERHGPPTATPACLDCHQQHGTPNVALLKAPETRACYTCHGDIEGPFVFEHVGPVVESCSRCHEAHGSVNRHLLARQQVAQLCYECHTVTPPDHVQPSYRDCTRCHVSIHGSNTDPLFLAP